MKNNNRKYKNKKNCITLLVINEEKNGKLNYVGANSFAEIAKGFILKNSVFEK